MSKLPKFPCIYVNYGEAVKRFENAEELGRFLVEVGEAHGGARLEDGIYKVCRFTPDGTFVLGTGETLSAAYVNAAETQARRRYPVLWAHETIEDQDSIQELIEAGGIAATYAKRWQEFLER